MFDFRARAVEREQAEAAEQLRKRKAEEKQYEIADALEREFPIYAQQYRNQSMMRSTRNGASVLFAKTGSEVRVFVREPGSFELTQRTLLPMGNEIEEDGPHRVESDKALMDRLDAWLDGK